MMFPFLKKAVTNAFTKPSTEAFPCPEAEGLGKYRGRIAFDGEKCIDCGMCIKVCAKSPAFLRNSNGRLDLPGPTQEAA